jgi:hypothetical protein
VQHAELSLIIWDDRPGGASFGIRVMPQTGPRHRSHVPLSPAECRALGLPPLASVIRTADPMIAIRAAQAAVLGACSADLLQRIGATIGRARFAADYEQAMTPPLVGARR